jgi:hypothetical protein
MRNVALVEMILNSNLEWLYASYMLEIRNRNFVIEFAPLFIIIPE